MENVESTWLWFTSLLIGWKITVIILFIFAIILVTHIACELVSWLSDEIACLRRRYLHLKDIKKDIRATSEIVAQVFPFLCVSIPIFWLMYKIWNMEMELRGDVGAPFAPGGDPSLFIIMIKGLYLLLAWGLFSAISIGWFHIVNVYGDSIYYRMINSYWGLYLVPFLLIVRVVKKRKGQRS